MQWDSPEEKGDVYGYVIYRFEENEPLACTTRPIS